MKKSKKKKKKIRRRIFIILGIVAVLFIAFALLFFTRVKNVEVEGNEFFTDEQIEATIFDEDFNRKPLIILWNEIFNKHKIIPFVDSYKVKLTGLTSAKVVLDIKSMVGRLSYGTSNIYVNRDGLVVESTTDIYPDIPLVMGLGVDETVPGMSLPIESEKLDSMLEIKHFLSDNTISYAGVEGKAFDVVDRVNFDDGGNIEIYVGEICVRLGSSYHLAEKLREMVDILPSLEGKSGTLHLEDYSSTDDSHVYRFE